MPGIRSDIQEFCLGGLQHVIGNGIDAQQPLGVKNVDQEASGLQVAEILR